MKNEVTVLSMIILTVAGFLFMYISSIEVLFVHTFRFFLTFVIKGGRKSRLYTFYLVLSRARVKGTQPDERKQPKEVKSEEVNREDAHWISDYVESYRHLREHGNAFGILLSEILFAWFLVRTSFSISGLVFWLAFGFLSWWVATYMEIKLQKNHIHFYTNEKNQ